MTEEEYNEGRLISIVVGLYYTLNASIPIIAWYGWRRPDILAMEENVFYKVAWYSLYPLHFIVFTPMAFLWPMTYSGVSVVVNFYDLANWWLGSVVAGFVYIFVASMFALAGLTYSETSSQTNRGIWQELVLYLLIEAFAWYTSVWEYSKAHEQFYYANRTELIASDGPSTKSSKMQAFSQLKKNLAFEL